MEPTSPVPPWLGQRVDPRDSWWSSDNISTSSSSSTTPTFSQAGTLSSSWSGSYGASSSGSVPTTTSPISNVHSGQSFTTETSVFTTSYPLTIIQSSTTFVSYSSAVVTSLATAPLATSSSPSTRSALRVAPVCIGDGLDAWSSGLIATIVLSSAVGILLWIIFAIVRPRFRQVYALREWFPPLDLRSRPLSSSFYSFLFPPVPLVPAIPTDLSEAGRSIARDAELFPSDEELSQRTIWIALLICLGWTVIAFGGALPLYMVSIPCLAHSVDQGAATGAYSVVHDLSLLRLLAMFDATSTNTSATPVVLLHSRAIHLANSNARIRTIVLTVLVLVGVILALWKVLTEFSTLVAYRRRWVEIRCEGQEMGWLSASKAPGFVGWGEQRLKEYILKMGLSSTLDIPIGDQNGRRDRRRRPNVGSADEKGSEIDVQTLFTVGDTEHLAFLIDERDEILEHVEIAETKYIASFQNSTPDPSIADYEVPAPEPVPGPAEDSGLQNWKPLISRPRPLNGAVRPSHVRPRKRRARNPAYASSSLPPTSYLMPSSFYKLRGLQGVSGDHISELDVSRPQMRQRDVSFSESVNQRIVGSRFQEINRNSLAYGRLPLGVPLRVGEGGELGPIPSLRSTVPSSISDLMRYGPNHAWTASPDPPTSGYDSFFQRPRDLHRVSSELGEEWVDLLHEPPQTFDDEPDHYASATNAVEPEISHEQRRPPRPMDSLHSDYRETFPLRLRNQETRSPDIVPPHLRVQPQQPFVRPISGMDHEELSAVYADISLWRTRLKAVNVEITEAQRDCYIDIADGARVKGWLMVGKGLRFLPGVELIEGRSKEDIKWDELQRQGGIWDVMPMWAMVAIVLVLLAAALTAVAGLILTTTPDVALYLTFLERLANTNSLATGIVTVLSPTLAATLFITIALVAIHIFTRYDGRVSVSGSRLVTFKATFFTLTIVAGIWLIAVGAILFAVEHFQSRTHVTKSIANGSIIMAAFALALIANVAIISPGLLLLQPYRLWKVTRAEKWAVTPRQRFRATYPQPYDPSYALACCILGVVFVSTFALIFPFVAPAAALLLFLTLIAHRYLIGYVYGRTQSSTGGLFQIWLLGRFATLLALQPLLLGLIFLTRSLWEEAGVLLSTSFIVVIFVETFCRWKTRLSDARSLSNITQNSLRDFRLTARPSHRRHVDEESVSFISSARSRRDRGSLASVLDMMSLTLAVAPSPLQIRGPVPIQTETLDDLTATERAARAHPDAPPHIPPLPFTDHAVDMAGILYAPELIAPPPIIWLPHDTANIAQSEAVDLQQYHALQVTLDVPTQEDVLPGRSTSIRMRRTSQ